MNEAQKTSENLGENYDDEEFGLMDLMIIFAKNKALIIFFPMVAALIGGAIDSTVTYRASAKILPPQESQSGATALLAQLSGVTGAATGIAGLKNSTDMYIGMLKSRTIADKLISRFDLKKVYGTDSQDQARQALAASTVITTGKDGFISIEVVSNNKQLVAPIANGYIEELVTQRRKLFEQHLEIAKRNLSSAEMTLKLPLNTRGVIATSSPEYIRAEEELNERRPELSKLQSERGTDTSSVQQNNGQVRMEDNKILRDVKYYHMLYELFVKQYEVMRLDEAKKNSAVQVLDFAIEPEGSRHLQWSSFSLVAGAVALAAAILWALLRDARQKALQRPHSAMKWRELESHLWGR